MSKRTFFAEFWADHPRILNWVKYQVSSIFLVRRFCAFPRSSRLLIFTHFILKQQDQHGKIEQISNHSHVRYRVTVKIQNLLRNTCYGPWSDSIISLNFSKWLPLMKLTLFGNGIAINNVWKRRMYFPKILLMLQAWLRINKKEKKLQATTKKKHASKKCKKNKQKINKIK